MRISIVPSSAIRFQRPQKVIDSSQLTDYNTDLLSLYIRQIYYSTTIS